MRMAVPLMPVLRPMLRPMRASHAQVATMPPVGRLGAWRLGANAGEGHGTMQASGRVRTCVQAHDASYTMHRGKARNLTLARRPYTVPSTRMQGLASLNGPCEHQGANID